MPPAKSERFIVTGASGTLGSRVLARIAKYPKARVLALLRQGSRIRHEHGDNIVWKRVDFFDRKALARICSEFEPTCIIHSAASGVQFPRPEWFELIHFNVDTSIDLCERAASAPGCKFVYISTGLAYKETGRPLRETDSLDTLHPYGASKAAADMLVRSAAAEFGVPLTVVRPFSFTGLNDDGTRLFPSLLRAALEGRPMDVSPGNQVRDHCAIEDVAAGIVAAAVDRREEASGIFNLGSGRDTILRQVVEEVIEDLRLKVEVNWGARAYARFEPMHLVADLKQSRSILGWRPRISLSYAVWELARSAFPLLKVRKPSKTFSP